MSDTLEDMGRKIVSASKLKIVVRIMKIMSASQIKTCEEASLSSQNYYANIEKALLACLRIGKKSFLPQRQETTLPVVAIVFGTDQGLVGSFNVRLAQYVKQVLVKYEKSRLFVVGERLKEGLEELQLLPEKAYAVPQSVNGIGPLVQEILTDMHPLLSEEEERAFVLIHNRPGKGNTYEPVCVRILPLDETWKENLMRTSWPTHQIPEIMEEEGKLLFSLLNEYLFIALSRASAESMACENVSRFLSMQHAEKNIDETLSDLSVNFHRIRQTAIDAELFDITRRPIV